MEKKPKQKKEEKRELTLADAIKNQEKQYDIEKRKQPLSYLWCGCIGQKDPKDKHFESDDYHGIVRQAGEGGIQQMMVCERKRKYVIIEFEKIEYEDVFRKRKR